MHIEESWLKSLAGKSFYYPAAAEDVLEAISLFSSQISKFYFCDLRYPMRLLSNRDLLLEQGYVFQGSTRSGDIKATLEDRYDGANRKYRWLNPSAITSVFADENGRQIELIYRRGFGQIGLSELRPQELGVFMHRGDSAAEGGSGVFYLANKQMQFKPISNLFNLIASKAGNELIVVSDGSNTDISELRFKRRGDSGPRLYDRLNKSSFDRYGFHWRCIGWMQPRHGPTLIWGLKRASHKFVPEVSYAT